jgi:hypothetical protein
MTEADQHMLQLWLEPVLWDHFAEIVEQKGEGQFQAIDQRASEEQVTQSAEPPTADSIVGVTIVVRSETTISAFREASPVVEAENATADILWTVVEALPKGAILDLIVETTAMYQALKSCADIVSHGWEVDQCCQHLGWRIVMTTWKDQQIQATIREYDEQGVDSENRPLRGLAMREAIQAVRDGMHTRDTQEWDA